MACTVSWLALLPVDLIINVRDKSFFLTALGNIFIIVLLENMQPSIREGSVKYPHWWRMVENLVGTLMTQVDGNYLAIMVPIRFFTVLHWWRTFTDTSLIKCCILTNNTMTKICCIVYNYDIVCSVLFNYWKHYFSP